MEAMEKSEQPGCVEPKKNERKVRAAGWRKRAAETVPGKDTEAIAKYLTAQYTHTHKAA